jgi:hypothetical protein
MTDESSYEELEQPRPARRWVPALLTVVVLAAVTVGVIRMTGTSSSPRPIIAVGSMDRRAPLLPIRMPIPQVAPSYQPPVYQPPRACPPASDGQNGCATYHRISAEFLAAVRERYPRVFLRSAVTQMLRASGPEVSQGLWSVQFIGSAPRFRLRIAIERAEPTDKGGDGSGESRSPAGRLVAYVRVVLADYIVQVEARSGTNLMPESFRLASLANDPRLFAPTAATMDR